MFARLLAIGLLTAAALCLPQCASAQWFGNADWCAQDGVMGPENCTFSSFQQCQQYIFGQGNLFCISNPHPRLLPVPAPAKRRRAHRHHS
jgi:hypothetical protein